MTPLASVALAAVIALQAIPNGTGQSSKAASIIGTRRGTSTCTDRVVTPACNDEEVIYDFTAGDKIGVVHWIAGKVVNGKREDMGEFDLTFDTSDSSWKAQFGSPRPTIEWRVVVIGDRIAGTGRHLPGKEIVRQIDVRRVR